MAKIVITNGTIHSDEDFNLTSGANANTRSCFRICKERDSHTRLRSLSSFRIKSHDFLNTGNVEVCGNLTVHGTCTTLNTTLTSTTTSTENNLTIVSTDAGAADAPDFKLYRNSASPANGDDVGKIKFTGNDTAGNETLYSGIYGEIITSGTGDECGRLVFETLCAGSNFRIATMEQNGLWVCNNRNFYLAGGGSLRNYGSALNLSTGGGDYKIVFQPNSTTKMCLDAGTLTVCDQVCTPILRASSCTHYGACGSSKLDSLNDSMRHTTQYGYIAIGPGNSSWAHITTDRNCFYFNAPITVDGGHIRSYDEDLYFSRGTSTTNRINIGTAKTTSCQPMNICGSGGAAVICAAHDLDAYATIGRARIGHMCCIANDWAGFGHLDGDSSGDYALLQNSSGQTLLNAATDTNISFRINNSQCALFCSDGSFTACKGIRATGSGWIYASSYFQGCRLYPQGYTGCFHFCSGNMACNAWMTAGRLYPGGSWLLNSQQGYMIPNTSNATCWLKFGAMCIPQNGYKMQMKVVASNGYGSNSDSTQETTLIFQTANFNDAGSGVCAAVHSFIEGSTKHECGAPYCFIVHEVNSSFYEFFGKFNSYTGGGSYYTVDHGPASGWIACNAFVDPDSCTGSCLLSVPNRGTIFCASSSTTCICGSAIVQGDICMNNNSRGYRLGTDTAGSGSRAFLVLDSDGSDGIGAGSDYFFVANDGSDTRFYNEGPEHIRLCGSSCVAFCKPIAVHCCARIATIRNFTNTTYMCLCGGCCLIGGIQFKDCQGCNRGWVYHDGTNNFGLLNCNGQWSLRIDGVQSSGSIYSCHTHCFMKNIGLYGGSASRVCIGGNRAIEGNSGILSLGEDFTSICLRAGCTYSTGNICTTACVQAAVVCATSCAKVNRIQALDGLSCFSAAVATADDWECSALHIRERGLVGVNQSHNCYAPNINFHWAGRISNSLWMNSSGHLKWGSYNGNGCPDGANGQLCAGIMCGGTCVKSPIVCGSTCLATNVISSSGSAASDYGALQIQGAKGGYGGVHFCGTTFMSASDCGGGGIYNDSCNGWVLYYACGGSTYLYYDGSAKLHTLENGVRACKSGCGYIDLCPSGSWAHIITDRNNYYFNCSLAVNSGCIGSYDEDLILHRGHANTTAAERITITSGTTHICQLTKIHGNLCVTGQVCADGMEGDTLSCADVCTGTVCFNTSCVTGYDAVYDVYVSANPNCGGSSIYRDIVHMSVYVTTGWNGSAVTKYINHVNNFVRGAIHDSGAGSVTAVPKLLVGTTGCECYAAACATCLQIQVAGGSNKNNTCVKIKRVF